MSAPSSHQWVKSSYSGDRDNCVEWAPAWHKSTYSGNTNDACVEVADCTGTGIHLRDSKLADSPVLTFSGSRWNVFVHHVKQL